MHDFNYGLLLTLFKTECVVDSNVPMTPTLVSSRRMGSKPRRRFMHHFSSTSPFLSLSRNWPPISILTILRAYYDRKYDLYTIRTHSEVNGNVQKVGGRLPDHLEKIWSEVENGLHYRFPDLAEITHMRWLNRKWPPFSI